MSVSHPLRLSHVHPGLQNVNSDTVAAEASFSHNHSPVVKVLQSPKPRYFGPGQLLMWPTLDLKDEVQLGAFKCVDNPRRFRLLLEETTIQVLKRNFGIEAVQRHGHSGLWVESDTLQEKKLPPLDTLPDWDLRYIGHLSAKYSKTFRCIATVEPQLADDNVTVFGVTINVTQPQAHGQDDDNPWARIGQEGTMTSIAAEVAAREARQELWQDPYENDPNHVIDRESAATLLASHQFFPLAVAWAHEFAQQLGMDDTSGVVEHCTSISPRASNISAWVARWAARKITDNHNLPDKMPIMKPMRSQSAATTYLRQVHEFAYINEETVIAWPYLRYGCEALLGMSVAGGVMDTRLNPGNAEKVHKFRNTTKQTEHHLELAQPYELERHETKQGQNERVLDSDEREGQIRQFDLEYEQLYGREAATVPLEWKKNTQPFDGPEIQSDPVLPENDDHRDHRRERSGNFMNKNRQKGVLQEPSDRDEADLHSQWPMPGRDDTQEDMRESPEPRMQKGEGNGAGQQLDGREQVDEQQEGVQQHFRRITVERPQGWIWRERENQQLDTRESDNHLQTRDKLGGTDQQLAERFMKSEGRTEYDHHRNGRSEKETRHKRKRNKRRSWSVGV